MHACGLLQHSGSRYDHRVSHDCRNPLDAAASQPEGQQAKADVQRQKGQDGQAEGYTGAGQQEDHGPFPRHHNCQLVSDSEPVNTLSANGTSCHADDRGSVRESNPAGDVGGVWRDKKTDFHFVVAPRDRCEHSYDERWIAMQRLETKGKFAVMARASLSLQTMVRTQILEASLKGEDMELEVPVTQLTTNANVTLAREAAELLEHLKTRPRAVLEAAKVPHVSFPKQVGQMGWDTAGSLGTT